jgi:hypothetical protein
MASQTISLLALTTVLAFLAHAYYRWRNDSLRKLRGPGSSSFLYGGYHGYLLDSRSSLVAQETNLMFAIRRKLGIASSNGRANTATSGDSKGASALVIT